MFIWSMWYFVWMWPWLCSRHMAAYESFSLTRKEFLGSLEAELSAFEAAFFTIVTGSFFSLWASIIHELRNKQQKKVVKDICLSWPLILFSGPDKINLQASAYSEKCCKVCSLVKGHTITSFLELVILKWLAIVWV